MKQFIPPALVVLLARLLTGGPRKSIRARQALSRVVARLFGEMSLKWAANPFSATRENLSIASMDHPLHEKLAELTRRRDLRRENQRYLSRGRYARELARARKTGDRLPERPSAVDPMRATRKWSTWKHFYRTFRLMSDRAIVWRLGNPQSLMVKDLIHAGVKPGNIVPLWSAMGFKRPIDACRANADFGVVSLRVWAVHSVAVSAGAENIEEDVRAEPSVEHDIFEAVDSLPPGSGRNTVKDAVDAVHRARVAQNEARGERILGHLFADRDEVVDSDDLPQLPNGWHWATDRDILYILHWGTRTSACLIRVLTGECHYPWSLDEIAIGPKGQVVGFTDDGLLSCPTPAWSCDNMNRHDEDAFMWAAKPRPFRAPPEEVSA